MLPLRHSEAPVLSIYRLNSHYLPTNMSDDKKVTGSYTHLQIDHKYIAVNRNQFCVLDNDFSHTTLQHDHLHVPTKPLLLFKRLVPNCYIAILNHAPTKLITDTCRFRYYPHKVVPTTLVSTANHFCLLNVNTEIVVVCVQSKHKIIRQVHSISIISRKDLCLCTTYTNYIIILGTHSNCTTDGQFKIYYTFNFATEWMRSGNDIALDEDNMELLNSPSYSFLPLILILDIPNSDKYKERKIAVISLHKLSKLVKFVAKDKILFLQTPDKNRENNRLLNESIENEYDSEPVDDMSTCFGGDIKYFHIHVCRRCHECSGIWMFNHTVLQAW